ncbi:hypothetical protein ACFE04_000993 [Oxalis oulophora]
MIRWLWRDVSGGCEGRCSARECVVVRRHEGREGVVTIDRMRKQIMAATTALQIHTSTTILRSLSLTTESSKLVSFTRATLLARSTPCRYRTFTTTTTTTSFRLRALVGFLFTAASLI